MNPLRRLLRACSPWLALALAGCGGTTICIEGAPCGPVPTYDENLPEQVQTPERFVALALGNWHSCMIDTAGAAWCWGSNEYGQLGAASSERCDDDLLDCSPRPLPVDGGHRFVQLAASDRHNCGLAPDGQAWCWGLGLGGQLGDGRRADSRLPVPVAGGHRFAALTASLSGGTTCGLKDDGSLWCWGIGLVGSVGPAASSEPQRWAEVGSVALRSAGLGEMHACGLDADGRAWCWGHNGFGELGNGGTTSSTVPVPVAGGRVYRQLEVGPNHACALDAAGQAWCWGFAAAGDGGPLAEARRIPVAVSGGLTFERIAAGLHRSCGLTAGGSAWCWGSGTTGGLGNGRSRDSAVPVAVAGDLVLRAVGAGGMASCGIDTSGQAWCWGWNSTGALGKPPVAH
jgi:alpha-tubulin suppressor-like RCC1 family protein